MSDVLQGKKPLKVAVLCGWAGAERQVSLQSGRSVSDALRAAGVEVIECDIRPGEIEILSDSTIDLFFLALHGQFGEDGQIQAILSAKGLAYTGSASEASRCAFDKRLSKNVFVTAGIRTPKSIEFDGKSDSENLRAELAYIADKFVVKPASQGSSVGVSIVVGAKAAVRAAKKCMKKFGDCIIEEFISGRELTVGIVDGKVLPIIEIKTKTDFYDYNAKYIDERTEFLFDS
ncbi:MAG: ATP-grasp domain-containing protein, partial [Planctomycetes bacterium]|nr:ATP-grasp domain-containing protein [Planctomycetota bacterium]